MADVHDADTRSYNMSCVKSKNTKPEIWVRKYLFACGFRYRINVKKLPGTPDIVLPKYKTAIFVNGCFWHMHENCKYSSIPKNNHEFWEKKLTGNVKRDRDNYKKLEDMGIKVIVVWGCEIKKIEKDNSMLRQIVDQIVS